MTGTDKEILKIFRFLIIWCNIEICLIMFGLFGITVLTTQPLVYYYNYLCALRCPYKMHPFKYVLDYDFEIGFEKKKGCSLNSKILELSTMKSSHSCQIRYNRHSTPSFTHYSSHIPLSVDIILHVFTSACTVQPLCYSVIIPSSSNVRSDFCELNGTSSCCSPFLYLISLSSSYFCLRLLVDAFQVGT
ncbi:hypothetical protein AGLY_003215 [Aphis glycines]|uniref:Uncharacterized protein n=1 Tax=Aphis glycines TaxID=307491 RepID=A0A6G0U2K1_APHGL|nr:hypothetical protein AGLY_003215 [Aphis glycines]